MSTITLFLDSENAKHYDRLETTMRYVLIILTTAVLGCGITTTIAYDSTASPEISETQIQAAIASNKTLKVTFTDDSNKLITVTGTIQKGDTGYRFTPRHKRALGNNVDSIWLKRTQIKNIEIIQKEGLRESETATLLITLSLIALVAASISVAISLNPSL